MNPTPTPEYSIDLQPAVDSSINTLNYWFQYFVTPLLTKIFEIFKWRLDWSDPIEEYIVTFGVAISVFFLVLGAIIGFLWGKRRIADWWENQMYSKY